MSTPRNLLIGTCCLFAGMILPGCQTVTKVVSDPNAPAARSLIRVDRAVPGIHLDVRYATTHNFTGRPLYKRSEVWLQRDVASALVDVEHDLAGRGLGLKIFDGYRPLSVQRTMWDLIHDERYVSNPSKNAGRHTRGTAVDVSLVDRAGRELAMPTAFDDFTPKAHRDAKDISPVRRRNSEVLEAAMVRRGFIPYPFEWWHFDYSGWERRPPLDVPFP